MKTCPVVKVLGISDILNSKLKMLVTGHIEIEYKDIVACLVTGGHYVLGQLGFIIPVDAYVPEKLLREMWLWNEEKGKGRLSGKLGNRVSSKIMDGERSDFLFYGAYYVHNNAIVPSPSWNPDWEEHHDVSEELGITFK